MIEFRCPSCGKGLRVEDGFAGQTGKCVACGRPVDIPKPLTAEGIRVADGGITGGIGKKPPQDAGAPPDSARRFLLAEAHCKIWRSGELPPTNNPEHRVADASSTGLRVILAAQAKRKTLVHLHKALWVVGDQVELDLTVGAFASPIRLYAKIMRTRALGFGKGTELGLQITKADEEAQRRLKLLEEREDLRQRRKRDAFDH